MKPIRLLRLLRCRLLGHFPDFLLPYRANAGLDFATCLHCGEAILKPATGVWRRPARGMAIVWRPRADATPRVAQAPARPSPAVGGDGDRQAAAVASTGGHR